MSSKDEKFLDFRQPLSSPTTKSRLHHVRLAILLILVCTVTFTLSLQSTSRNKINQNIPTTREFSGSDSVDLLTAAAAQSKNAFSVFLDLDSASKQEDGSDDRYFIGTRMIIYQLLHDRVTRTRTNNAFVVLVSRDVNELRRERLRADGAIVIQTDSLSDNPVYDWIKPGRNRWVHVIDKLHVFKLTMFEKIILFDSDTVIVRRLDDIFVSPEAAVQDNKANIAKIEDDEGPQPPKYIMAGNSGPYSQNHSYPSERGNKLNAGFVVLKPTIEMYDYYLSIATIEDRFNPSSPEQNLWNYAHRLDGNMPWVQIDPDWTANTPNYGDFENGIASFHEKWWACEKELKLRDVLRRSRWNMEGFWIGKRRLQGHLT